ncbi:MAG TPA: isocitrate lyase/phosphoenolpyruvate mutase family protein [Xanthobacteraceae bacterium]|nr:isocitrate lyase/phosphoenolpyruvate mutase family protein [Xanthobacteraceae bacterium]
MTTTAERRRIFRQLHEAGCFVIPNPWDVGSARYLKSLGFKALATTSAGAAWSMGYADGRTPPAQMLAHIREIVEATDLPVNADFEGGYVDAPDALQRAVRDCMDTGVAGLSIEDYTGDRNDPIYPFDLAVARIAAARAAIDRAGGEVLLVGRAEGLIRNRPDFDEILRRLKAYAAAGADCLYAPGLKTREEIAAVVAAAAPKPVNVLMGTPSPLTVADLAALGVRRISVGGSLARSAWGGLMRAAKRIAEAGDFNGFADAASGPELNALFSASSKT